MPLVTTTELIGSAYRSGSGLAAYNVITLEHAEAIVTGAQNVETPVILQVSQNAVRFHQHQVTPIAAAMTEVAQAASVDVSIHLDHVEDTDLLHATAAAGASSVMFDASKLDYAANVDATRNATDWAHSQGLFLEAELGEIGGKDGAHAPGVRTDPREAAEFVAATGVDALAVAVGSSHAMSSRTAKLDIELISRLRSAVPVPLVLHGSSGVTNIGLHEAVEAGITKINVGTALNEAFTSVIRERLRTDEGIDPRKYLAPARDAIGETVSSISAAISWPPCPPARTARA